MSKWKWLESNNKNIEISKFAIEKLNETFNFFRSEKIVNMH